MSHIPNSAMPHAGASQESQQDQGGATPSLSERAGKIAEYARENPKTAIAAGAAVAAGVVAAAIPLVRGRKSESSSTSRSKSGSSKSGSSSRSKSGGSKGSGSSKKS